LGCEQLHPRFQKRELGRPAWLPTTGDVSYTLNGKLSVIDRGRRVTVLNQNEAAIVFGLEMAVQNGIFVELTDPEMRDALYLLQRLANPRQRQQERGGR
jgi:hypothetical protein